MEPDTDSILLFFTLVVFPSIEVILAMVGIIILLMASALISGSEVAYFSLSPNDVEKLSQEASLSNKRILKLKEQPRSLLATILISNNFINIAIVIISDYVLNNILPSSQFTSWSQNIIPYLQKIPLFANATALQLADIISFIITVIGVTFILVLFGEVAPKVYAKLNNIQLARFMSLPLIVLGNVLSPFNNILVSWTKIIERRLVRSTQNGALASREDIDEAIELAVNTDADTEQEVDILKRIVKFGEVSAKQIMRSRVDVIAIDFRIDYKELIKIVKENGYSRLPVYDNDFDNVTGILYVKDLLGHLNAPSDFEWQQLIRTDVLYVPEAKKIDDLLREFQSQRKHMAIVVDEYGGSSGIVTLEDIMEEVIGDIKDEFDDHEEVEYKKIDDFNYLFEGKTLLNDVCRVMGLDTNTFDEVKGEADSLAGLVLEFLGHLPKQDKEITYNQFKFKIVSVSKRRIIQILITLPK